ncbi:MAG: AAA family ATPase [Lachnospiraceae bacterium]|nr:AAA family ATPase [Lachnospiraceae bacterium]
MAKTIAITNKKSGVAKTITAATMSYLLTKMGYKALLIDYDG